jgi:hypothetical protein
MSSARDTRARRAAALDNGARWLHTVLLPGDETALLHLLDEPADDPVRRSLLPYEPTVDAYVGWSPEAES